MCGILSFTPLDLVDLFFDFKGFQVVELWFVGLKFGIKFVFASFFLIKVSVKDTSKRLVADRPSLSTAQRKDSPFRCVQTAQHVRLCHQLRDNFLWNQIPPSI